MPGVLFFLEKTTPGKKSVTDIFPFWLRALAVVGENVHYRTNISKEKLVYSISFANIKTEIEQTVDVEDILQSSFKFTLRLGDKTV